MRLTDEELYFLWMIHTTPANHIIADFQKAGLSENELAELKAILSE